MFAKGDAKGELYLQNLTLSMFNYHAWANQTLFTRLLELPPEVYHQEVQSVFPSISGVVSHMYTVDQLWFHIVAGMDMPQALDVPKDAAEGKSIGDMMHVFQALYDRCRTVLIQLADRMDERRPIHIPWEGHTEISPSEMVVHIVTHGTYHRGNITAMLRQMGHPSVTTDMTVFWFAHRDNG